MSKPLLPAHDKLSEALLGLCVLATSLRDYLAAQDATKAYMRAIPDGCMPEQNHLGRLLNAEEKTEAAARAALAKAEGRA